MRCRNDPQLTARQRRPASVLLHVLEQRPPATRAPHLGIGGEVADLYRLPLRDQDAEADGALATARQVQRGSRLGQRLLDARELVPYRGHRRQLVPFRGGAGPDACRSRSASMPSARSTVSSSSVICIGPCCRLSGTSQPPHPHAGSQQGSALGELHGHPAIRVAVLPDEQQSGKRG